jgi:transposase
VGKSPASASALGQARTGAPWRDLPERYGPWKTAHERLRKWTADGTWDRVLAEVIVKDCGRRGGVDLQRKRNKWTAWTIVVNLTNQGCRSPRLRRSRRASGRTLVVGSQRMTAEAQSGPPL